ncbi:MAG: propionyl-CoA carboxylase [Spirochaetaceae bacterium]|nr:propionyl-CoA carboxylase [Spirochaetaceae bacterium]HPG26983.1 carboxyl transferase domain-containing protein [Myxococcota bacterium]
MSWQDEVDEIEARREAARAMGGPEAVERQHARGRLTVRERLERLADPGSIEEQAPLAGESTRDAAGRAIDFQPANYLLALARVDGRPIVVGGEDFTQRGGSPSPSGLRRSVYAETLAIQLRRPLVRFLDGGGGSVAGQARRDPSGGTAAPAPPRPVGDPVYAPSRFASIARLLEVAPVASAAVGAVAGFPAARLAASHFSVMTRDTAQVLIGGPALVERALGEKRTKEELGGARIHSRSGVVDNVARDEDDAIEQIRRFLSYLPTSVLALPPCEVDPRDDPDRRDESLLSVVPRDRRKIYAMRAILASVFDRESFFETTPGFGRSLVTGLARLAGRPVGVLANDPRHYAGSMDAAAARKLRRFVDLCDTFHLPIVSLVDEPGFMIGQASERAGTMRFGIEAITRVVTSRVPWCSVLVRKAYGVAAAAHFGPEATVLAWPSAESGALPIEGGVDVAFRREIESAPDPDARRAELEAALAARRSPMLRAEAFSIHDLIDPRETRPRLCRWIERVWPRLREQVPSRLDD